MVSQKNSILQTILSKKLGILAFFFRVFFSLQAYVYVDEHYYYESGSAKNRYYHSGDEHVYNSIQLEIGAISDIIQMRIMNWKRD